jgi:hypothetical protein
MRAQLHADAIRVAAAQADFRLSQEEVRNMLRAEPFDLAALRAAEEHVQSARDNYHLVLHRVIESAVTKMSVTGRNKVADWSSARENASAAQ